MSSSVYTMINGGFFFSSGLPPAFHRLGSADAVRHPGYQDFHHGHERRQRAKSGPGECPPTYRNTPEVF
jgi:hypothetical protein